MNDVQIGSAVRAVRIRRGMSQAEVAASAGLSRSVVSAVERGQLEVTSLRLVRRVAGAVGMSLTLEARWRGEQLATLLDERHAQLVRSVVAKLDARGWTAAPEHTFNVNGERGSVDVLAWQPASRALACIEVKTRLADLQDLLSAMDRKRRLAPALARTEGWKPLLIASVLVLPEETWARNAVRRFDPIFQAALPARTADLRSWFGCPDRDIRGIWFLLNDVPGSTKRRRGGSMRVRPRKCAADALDPRSAGCAATGSSPEVPGRPRLALPPASLRGDPGRNRG
jgi:transcriptional regulator with XRE-family HTH domain